MLEIQTCFFFIMRPLSVNSFAAAKPKAKNYSLLRLLDLLSRINISAHKLQFNNEHVFDLLMLKSKL